MADCAASAQNYSAFINCVVKELDKLVKRGLITGKQKERIVCARLARKL